MELERKWVLSCVLTLVFGLVLVSLITVIIDPFFHFHSPIKGLQYPIDNERYQNDGIVRHFSYNAIVTGTSMTENFKTTQIDKIFDVSCVKVPFSGGRYKEINDNLKRAISANPNIRCIIRSLDCNRLLCDKDEKRTDVSYPDYLYDNIWLNDVFYVLNKDVLFDNSLRVLFYTQNGGRTTSFDEYARWNDDNVFGKEAVDKVYNRPKWCAERNKKFTQEERVILEGNIFQNVTSLAKENPQITFYLFFTPYSIYYWDSLNQEGNLNRQLKIEEETIRMLLEYDNILLFSFNDQFDMICDLNNYKDTVHYGEKINSKMLEWMYERKHLLTKDNYIEYCNKVRNFYTSFEYNSLFVISESKH